MSKNKKFIIIFIIISIIFIGIFTLLNINKNHEEEKKSEESNIIFLSTDSVKKKEEELKRLAEKDEKYAEKDPKQELIKEHIELSEANKLGIEINDEEQLNKFKEFLETEYSEGNYTEDKETFIKEKTEEMIEGQKRNLYYAEIIKTISTKTFKCEDQNVNIELQKLYDEPNPEQLNKVYEEYIKYLSRNYKIVQ